MVRALCGVKLLGKKMSNDLMHILDLKETMDQLAKITSFRWCEHALRKDKKNLLGGAFDLRVKETRKIGRTKKTGRKSDEEQSI